MQKGGEVIPSAVTHERLIRLQAEDYKSWAGGRLGLRRKGIKGPLRR